MSQPITPPPGPPGILAINFIFGGQIFHVYPYAACQEGVFLAMGQFDKVYDAPVKTTWKSGAFQVGSTQKAVKRNQRDMTLGFHIKENVNSYEFNESMFRQIFQYEIDMLDPNATPTTLAVQTSMSGWRYLDVLLSEEPEFKADLDPIQDQYGNLILKLRAGRPNWRTTLMDPTNPATITPIDPSLISTFTSTATSAVGWVTVTNPTDQTMYQKWILTVGTFTLPDVQWTGMKNQRVPGGANGTRAVTLAPITAVNGGAVIDLDGSNLMMRDANNTNIIGQNNGNFFVYPIPPYTPPTLLPVSYTAAPSGGAMIQLIQPQMWSRPWGLEFPLPTPLAVRPLLTMMATPGTYSYQIPPFADTIDVIALGGGGGGATGGFGYGLGGLAGQWQTATLVRGVGIPWASTTLSGTIGAGGVQGGNGSTTTVTDPSSTVSINASGGAGAAWTGNVDGQSPGTLTFDGQKYVGGAVAQIGRPGNRPGGAGAGGWWFGGGGAGAGGAVWFYAYQTAGGS